MKISFIGAGSVATTTAFAIGLDGLCEEMVLLDINANLAKGKAIDLEQSFILHNKSIKVIGTDDYADVKNSDVVIITAGVANQTMPNNQQRDNREVLLDKNKSIIQDIALQLKEVIPTDDNQPLIVMLTNPLDVILYHFIKTGNFNKKKTVGSGNLLDNGRYKFYLAKLLGVDATDISGMVVGQHGAKMVYLPSQTRVNGEPLLDYMQKHGIAKNKLDDIFEKASRGAYEIIELLQNGGTVFGPAISVYDIVYAYIKNIDIQITLSVFCNGEYGAEDVCIGLPVIINSSGIAKIRKLNITEEEQEKLNDSYKFIRSMIEQK